MNSTLKSFILNKTGARDAWYKEDIQSLWRGYGSIRRVGLKGSHNSTIILKNIDLNQKAESFSDAYAVFAHKRKLRSYEVEGYWYQNYSHYCEARIPKCYGVFETPSEVWILLEDLDAAGFSIRKQELSWPYVANCLQWLALFHASFLNKEPIGLWPIGTYWHLETRPYEMTQLRDPILKAAATKIDQKLNQCNFKTLVHGDAKLANFCFSENGTVAAVDFQYVGGGCGMKDLAYFVGSCLDENQSEVLENQILDAYFNYFNEYSPQLAPQVENEWRPLYSLAWADFHRFLKGWNPDHFKLNSYSERITKRAINVLLG